VCRRYCLISIAYPPGRQTALASEIERMHLMGEKGAASMWGLFNYILYVTVWLLLCMEGHLSDVSTIYVFCLFVCLFVCNLSPYSRKLIGCI
jgi:hypothetical protein